MQPKESIRELLAKAQAGDPCLKLQAESRLANSLLLVVQKTLSTGKEQTPLEHRIFTEARRLGFRHSMDSINNQEEFYRKVAGRVSRVMMVNLSYRRSAEMMSADTVCNGSDSLELAG
jgi:hypothetical protein